MTAVHVSSCKENLTFQKSENYTMWSTVKQNHFFLAIHTLIIFFAVSLHTTTLIIHFDLTQNSSSKTKWTENRTENLQQSTSAFRL